MKKIFLTITSFLLGGILSAAVVQAATPAAFNNLSGDQEFLRGRNLSRNQTTPADPVEASANEEVEVVVYYHNTSQNDDGSSGEVARNTQIKIVIPQAVSQSHLVTGQLSADNVAAITGTIVNGQEVGQPGLTVNTPDSATTLEFISGSAKWFPDGATNPVTLPFGQSGDEIVTSTGLNIGDIRGCWQFAGFVTFKIKINSEAGSPNIVRGKTAFNETQNQDATQISAKPDDIIRYQLQTANSGNGAGQVVVEDEILDILQYADVVDLGGGTVSENKISFGSISLNPGQSITKTFKVKIKNPLPNNGDFIMTNVYGNQVNVEVTPPPEGGPILLIDKQVRNKTRNTSYQNGSIANPGDTMEFRVTVQNRHGSNPAINVRIKDILDSRFEYLADSARLEIAGTFRQLPNELFGNGYVITVPNPSLGPVGQNDNLTFYLEAKIKADVTNDSSLANKACVSAEQFTEICDEVKVQVEVAPIPIVQIQPISQAPSPQFPFTGAPIQIPKTGPEAGMILALGLTSSLATANKYWQAKKALKKAIFGKKVL